MKIKIEINADLLQRANAEVALRGTSLDHLVEEGLRLALETRLQAQPAAPLSKLTKRAQGIVRSKLSDLATNGDHLAGFGKKLRHL